MVQHFVRKMQSEFEMSLVGDLTYFLGLQIKQMDDTIFISQSKYANSKVKKFGIENVSHKGTPAPTHLKLTKDEKGVNMDQSLYKSMIGSLLYLTASRPDITFAVEVCGRCQSKPKIRYCDADWEDNAYDRKSTYGGCFFLGNSLISWKHDILQQEEIYGSVRLNILQQKAVALN
ncbi:uncharacterized mitochondrial protein AtMg00810-like [Lathyrus oleraceus]|uniref:uncharacterized mitochondrial protein AtMg00810-like n=1 Tax=Pisum sativum TaxID=3888 RepID=UPI0021CF30FE|nr:uncharacterized mitochondrial protein AtMg00810-like [Pisum sativum]